MSSHEQELALGLHRPSRKSKAIQLSIVIAKPYNLLVAQFKSPRILQTVFSSCRAPARTGRCAA